jgi:hypothetical protein
MRQGTIPCTEGLAHILDVLNIFELNFDIESMQRLNMT